MSFAFHGASDARAAQLQELELEDLKSLQAELAKAKLSPADYRDKFKALLDQLEARFDELADLVASGEITAADFRYRAERALRSGYTQAYRYGTGSADGSTALTDADLAAIATAFAQDNEYLSKFADQIADGYVPVNPEDVPNVDGQVLLSDRANMYANSTREMFFRGQVARIAEDDEIEWVDSGDDSECDPCLEAAAGSPYTKDTLPGYPGDICDGGSRCRCELNYASQVAAQPAEEQTA
jgi:hypothetical protein